MDLCAQYVHLRQLPSAFWVVLFVLFSFFKTAEYRQLAERNCNYLAFPFSYLQETVEGGKGGKRNKPAC